jgi:hypothetical protein
MIISVSVTPGPNVPPGAALAVAATGVPVSAAAAVTAGVFVPWVVPPSSSPPQAARSRRRGRRSKAMRKVLNLARARIADTLLADRTPF